MPGPADIFRELHRLRRHATDLQTQIDSGPQRMQKEQARIARQQEGLKQAQETIKKLKVTTLEKESTLKQVNAQIKKHEKQLNEAAGKKEYDALQTEIANDRKEVHRLEDEILELMGDVEDRAAKLPELEKELQKTKQEVAQYERDYEARLGGLREQCELTLKTLAETEAALPADIKSIYERLINARGADGMSVVQDRVCTACYTAISPQQFNDLLLARFVMCKSCGRILYFAEASAS